MFRYGTIHASPAVAAALRNYFAANPVTETAARPEALAVSLPGLDITTSFQSYYLMGTSDPAEPLYLNGDPVFTRSESGYFGVLVPLAAGVNTFTLTQGPTSFTRTITRAAGGDADPLPYLSKPGIVSSSVLPRADEYRAPGSQMAFSCVAPIGAQVRVSFGGQNYELSPQATALPADDGKVYTTTFSVNCSLPQTGGDQVRALGAPVYSMSYGGRSYRAVAPGQITVLQKGAPVFATAAKTAWLYDEPSSADGNTGELAAGMKDYVVETKGGWVKLRLGRWVYRDNVRLSV